MSQLLYMSERYQKYYRRLEPIFKNRQVQAYTMVILSLLTIAFFGVFAIRPTLKTIATLHRQIDDKKELNQKLEQKITALIQAQDSYQQMQYHLEKIYSLMPAEIEFPSLIRRLELIGVGNSSLISSIQVDSVFLYNKSGLSASSSAETITTETTDTTLNKQIESNTAKTASITKTTPKYMQVLFSISYQGNYVDLANVINQLTKMDRLVSLNSFILNRNSNTGAGSLNLSLEARAYYMPL